MNILINFHARRGWPGLYDESFLHQPLESLSNDSGGNGKDMRVQWSNWLNEEK